MNYQLSQIEEFVQLFFGRGPAISGPTLKGKTNAALAEWALEMREALRLSSGDKKALREWADATY